MKLNVKKVLKEAAEKAAKPKPLPKVKVYPQPKPVINIRVESERAQTVITSIKKDAAQVAKELLLADLWIEFANLKRARGKLSTDTARQVETMEAMLKAENPRIAAEFMEGKIEMPELINHALNIQTLSDQMLQIWDNIRYVEQHGKLPTIASPEVRLKLQDVSIDVKAVRDEIRRLDDLICKTEKKVRVSKAGIKKPKNTLREATWNEKIALAEARRSELKLQLKNLHYEAREERTIAE